MPPFTLAAFWRVQGSRPLRVLFRRGGPAIHAISTLPTWALTSVRLSERMALHWVSRATTRHCNNAMLHAASGMSDVTPSATLQQCNTRLGSQFARLWCEGRGCRFGCLLSDGCFPCCALPFGLLDLSGGVLLGLVDFGLGPSLPPVAVRARSGPLSSARLSRCGCVPRPWGSLAL
jgi:hypothetical protein